MRRTCDTNVNLAKRQLIPYFVISQSFRKIELAVKYEYLRSLQLCEDQGILDKLKKRVFSHVLAILTTYMETRL